MRQKTKRKDPLELVACRVYAPREIRAKIIGLSRAAGYTRSEILFGVLLQYGLDQMLYNNLSASGLIAQYIDNKPVA